MRQSIEEAERQVYSTLVSDHLVASHFFLQATHIACYFSTQDELDTTRIITAVLNDDKNCYLPVVANNIEVMQFAHYDDKTLLHQNRYGILEPLFPDYINIALLDIVLMPLVAFDKRGYRLGMGGGYYDKTFSFLVSKARPAKPLLMGLAYAKQETAMIPEDVFDVTLDAIITEHGIHWFHPC